MRPAAGEGQERLDDLVPGAQRVGEGIEPDVDPVAHVREDVRHQRRPAKNRIAPITTRLIRPVAA
jgi:hypothetical protein